jgi:hypothetical protein
MSSVGLSVRSRLEAHKRVEGACWLWTGNCSPSGYGQITIDKKPVRVHRISYCLYHGIDLRDLKDLVLHTTDCPNRSCFNPAHLYAGDQVQNMADMLAVGHNTNKNKTYCKNGHEFTRGNTLLCKGNKRQCRMCTRLRRRMYRSAIQ